MHAEHYAELLREDGFQRIGTLDHQLQVSLWWNPATDKRIQIVMLTLGAFTLLKGDKSYYLQSVSADGVTWARDIGPLHDYLETHFPEMHLAFSHFRDVPPELADVEARRRMTADAPTQAIPSAEHVATLGQQLHDADHAAGADEQLLRLAAGPDDLLNGYIRHVTRSQLRQVEDRRHDYERAQARYEVLNQLQREYRRKGSAAVFTFSVSSNVQVIDGPGRFQVALRCVVNELADQHRFQIRQKLQGGRLNVHVVEAEQPLLCWIEQWFGGALSPTQLQRLGSASDQYRRLANDHTIVFPDEPIEVDAHVRHAETRLAARFVSSVLSRLDTEDGANLHEALDPSRMRPEMMPLWIGHRLDEGGQTIAPVAIPLSEMVHAIVSGTTGAGKSFLARVLVEEAAGHQQLNVLVIDPRNQFAGLLIPEDRHAVLQHYPRFDMSTNCARGFSFSYFAPGLDWTTPLPAQLGTLAGVRSIVSLKAHDDPHRCDLAADILDAVFDHMAVAESPSPKLLILVDEAQLLTQKRVGTSAKPAAARAQRAIDRVAREGRKYGIVLVLVSQTIKDFSYQLASLRQMASTKIFLRNSDREIEYADDILGDGRRLVQLPTGVALLHNANWGVHRIAVRPPFSKVFELPDAELRRILRHSSQQATTVTAEARNLLTHLRVACQNGTTMNVTQLARAAGIGSRRRLHALVRELELAGVIRSRILPERGSPRVIEYIEYNEYNENNNENNSNVEDVENIR